MLWLLILTTVLVFWWIFSSAEKKGRSHLTSRRDAGPEQPLRQSENHQPSNAVEAVPHRPGEQTHTITVHIDAESVMARVKDINQKRMKWSGKVNGPLPVKTLTLNQNLCLDDASLGKRIVASRLNESYGDAPEDIAFHPARTVDALVKHGFLVGDSTGAFVCSDLGLRAFEKLPARLN